MGEKGVQLVGTTPLHPRLLTSKQISLIKSFTTTLIIQFLVKHEGKVKRKNRTEKLSLSYVLVGMNNRAHMSIKGPGFEFRFGWALCQVGQTLAKKVLQTHNFVYFYLIFLLPKTSIFFNDEMSISEPQSMLMERGGRLLPPLINNHKIGVKTA